MQIARSLLTLLIIMLVATAVGFADDVNDEISDPEFLQRSLARLENVSEQARQLEEYGSQIADRNAVGAGRRSPTTYDDFGVSRERSRMTGQSTADRVRSITLKLRSTRRNADKERRTIGDLRREAATDDGIDRDAIESRVRRLEREIETAQRDLDRL